MHGFCLQSKSTSNICGVVLIAENPAEISWMKTLEDEFVIDRNNLKIDIPSEGQSLKLIDQIYLLCKGTMSARDRAQCVQGHCQISVRNSSLNLNNPKLTTLYERLPLQAILITTPS